MWTAWRAAPRRFVTTQRRIEASTSRIVAPLARMGQVRRTTQREEAVWVRARQPGQRDDGGSHVRRNTLIRRRPSPGESVDPTAMSNDLMINLHKERPAHPTHLTEEAVL